jgi:hypothetical protein
MRICALMLFLCVCGADGAAAFDDATGRPVVLSPAELAKIRSIVADDYHSNRETTEILQADAARDGRGELKVCLLSSSKGLLGRKWSFYVVVLKPNGELAYRLYASAPKITGVMSYQACLRSHVNMHFRVS